MIPLLLRADAGPHIGMGHVMRCLALAEPWGQAGSAVTLLTADPSPALQSRTETLGVSLRELSAVPGSPADAAETIALAQSLHAAWLVLDGYHFDAGFQRAVKAAGLRLLVFDDYGHAARYSADFILNQNLGASASLYPQREAATHLLLGPRFVQLRGEFLKRSRRREEAESTVAPHFEHREAGAASILAAGPDSQVTRSARADSVGKQGSTESRPTALDTQPPHLLVTLGGSDPDNVTAQVLAALQTIPGIAADIILGPANPHANALQSASSQLPASISFHTNPPNLPDLMARADLAICAGGTTAWEFCFLGVPMLVLVLAENQRANAGRLAEAGVAVHTSVGRLAEDLQSLLADAPRRAAMRRHARSLVDGQGAFRVWLRMNEDQLHLRPATPDDCRRVWEWANEPAVRAVSFTSDPIPWATHVAWFSRKLADANTRLWMAEQPGAPVSDPASAAAASPHTGSETGAPHALGQVRFDLEGGNATVSVSLDARRRGRNLGALLIWTACQKLFREAAVETIHACVKPDNAASLRAFEKAGFGPAGETSVNGCRALRLAFHSRPE